MRRYNGRNMPGPHDEATWPRYTGHPNDPRHDDSLDDETEDDRRKRIEDEEARADAFFDALDDSRNSYWD